MWIHPPLPLVLGGARFLAPTTSTPAPRCLFFFFEMCIVTTTIDYSHCNLARSSSDAGKKERWGGVICLRLCCWLLLLLPPLCDRTIVIHSPSYQCNHSMKHCNTLTATSDQSRYYFL